MASPPLLAARKLTAPLGPTRPALADVTFRLGLGERVLLAGPSGAGKSTLLRALVLLEPAVGVVELDGRPVTPATVRELRRRVAYLPQQPVPVAATVADNLDFARSVSAGLDRDDQRRLLARLGLEALDWSRRFTSLSGGEQQRVALVRSLTPEPDALLLDEPTASLDRENVADVLGLIRDWCGAGQGRALVWVSHRAGELEDFATRSVDVRELSPGAAR